MFINIFLTTTKSKEKASGINAKGYLFRKDFLKLVTLGKMRDRGKAHRCQEGPQRKEKGQKRKSQKDVREIPVHRDEGKGGDNQEGHGQQRQRRFDAEGRRLFLDCVHDEDGAG